MPPSTSSSSAPTFLPGHRALDAFRTRCLLPCCGVGILQPFRVLPENTEILNLLQPADQPEGLIPPGLHHPGNHTGEAASPLVPFPGGSLLCSTKLGGGGVCVCSDSSRYPCPNTWQLAVTSRSLAVLLHSSLGSPLALLTPGRCDPAHPPLPSAPDSSITPTAQRREEFITNCFFSKGFHPCGG